MRKTKRDSAGRFTVVEIPDDAPKGHEKFGIEIGPPDIGGLGLPLDVEVRLNNELYHRGILTKQDAVKRPTEIENAIRAALKLDTQKVIGAYNAEASTDRT